MLITIDQLLNTEEVIEARAMLKNSAWESGQSSAGLQAASVKNNQQLPEHAPHLPKLRALVMNALQRSPIFFSAALPLKILPPFFNRYADQTNAYGFHVDSAMRHVPMEEGAYLRSDLSATLFLSTPEDYDGGELSIVDTFGTHSVKLQAGSMVLYPSSSLHAVSSVTRGERLACFMFMQSMVRSSEQRRILYDMDMALLELRREFGEIDSVVKLTGSYHNLLRCWAEN